RTLANAGAAVAIFDPTHPREKPCGGGVTGRALTLVADAVAGIDLPTTAVARARFLDRNAANPAVVDMPRGALDVVARTDFDQALLAAACKAGARLIDRRVTDVSVDRSGARLKTGTEVHHARVLIGADGTNSLVRRRLSRPFPRSALSVATGYFA